MSIWTTVASGGIELLVWKIRPDHHQYVAVHHRVIAGGKAEQAGHADVKRVVVFDEFLPAHGMYDGRVELARECDQLRMSSGTAGSA